jgi:hypothetical protein
MKITRLAILLVSLLSTGFAQAQSMFRGDAAHSGNYAGSAPRQFHRVKWKFPTGNRIVSSPVGQDKVLYFVFATSDSSLYRPRAKAC